MTWARNHGDSCKAGWSDTKRAKRITKVCPDCGIGIPNTKKRCLDCAGIATRAANNRSSLAWRRRAKSTQNGGAT